MLDTDTELDIIFNAIDDWYWEAVDTPEKRNKIDLVLSQVTEDLPLVLLLGFLSTTLPHKEEFKFRPRIVGMVKRKKPDDPRYWIGLE
jgi:hypothetical protein